MINHKIEHPSAWTAADLSKDDCVVELDGKPYEVRLALPGAHQVLNALAAAAVGVAMQVAIETDQETVAAQFTHIDPESLLHLQQIIRYNSPNPDLVEQEISRSPTLT